MFKIISFLCCFSVLGFAQIQEDFNLQFSSETLQNSLMINVGGQEVPSVVVSEIEKICVQRQLTKDE